MTILSEYLRVQDKHRGSGTTGTTGTTKIEIAKNMQNKKRKPDKKKAELVRL